MDIGYKKPLYILAFDHRASFIKKMFGWEGKLSEEQKQTISDYKFLIYEGFKKGVEMGVPKDGAGLLVEEEFGDKVLKDAKENGFLTILTSETSGAEEFDFQYGMDFGKHIEKYKPAFTKALVRYNPQGDEQLNKRQAEKLKQLSDYSHKNGHKFLIEPLILPTALQLAGVADDKQRFDLEVRPNLTVEMIRQLQDAGVEPDIWKIEGMEKSDDYQAVVIQAKSDGRENVSVVVLGRGESNEHVERWLNAGKQVVGVVGFAIGRTIFWDVLADFRDKKLDRETAASQIGQNYLHFYQVFTQK